MDIRNLRIGQWARYDVDRLVKIVGVNFDEQRVNIEYRDSVKESSNTTWVRIESITSAYDNEFRSWEEAHEIVKLFLSKD